MMGKIKKPSECQITKNLRLYRCRVTRMRKAVWKEIRAFWGYRDAFHAARPSAVWDTSEK